MSKQHITYEQLMEIISWGIFTREVKNNQCNCNDLKPIKDAIYEGIYIGSPGRDIYYMLPYLSDEQIISVAKSLSGKFPIFYPNTNAQYSACIRFIYGQFEKQGVLRSDRDFKRMKEEKIEWELSRSFLNILKKEFKKDDKIYGLTILCEMEAHRLGDEAVINKDLGKLNKMEKMYLEAMRYSDQCKSFKHMFSLSYWASQYFKKFGNNKKMIEYSRISLLMSTKYYHKYFPNGDIYYSCRLRKIFSYIRDNDGVDFCKKIMEKVKSEKLKKVFNKEMRKNYEKRYT